MSWRKQYNLNLTPEASDATFDLSSHAGAHADSTRSVSTVVGAQAVDSSTINKDGAERTETEEEEPPVVFLCGNCRLPVGDSFSWAGSEEDRNQIVLNSVSENVLVGQEARVSGIQGESTCLLVELTCQGCSSLLGMVYMSTPKRMDFKRSLFFLDVAALESYVLGSSGQQVAELDPKEQPVTLEYKWNMEKQLSQIQGLMVTMGQRLLEVEAELDRKHGNEMKDSDVTS